VAGNVRREMNACPAMYHSKEHDVDSSHRLSALLRDLGMSGTQVIAALRNELGIALASVLATGDTSAAIKHLRSDPHLRIASKPIRADELSTRLRELLVD
jgi:hypothetical protein